MCIGNGDVFSITSETEDDIPGVMGGKETTETGREERRSMMLILRSVSLYS